MRIASYALAAVAAVSVGCVRDRESRGGVEGSSLSAGSSAAEIARFARTNFRELLATAPLREAGGRFFAPTTPFRRTGRLDASLGASAAKPVHLAVPGGEISAEIQSTDVRDVIAEVDREALVFANALPATHIVQSVDGGRFEELRVLTGPSAPSTAHYRIRASENVSSIRVRDGRIELLDRNGRPRLVAAPMVAVDAKGARRTLSVHVEGSPADTTVTATLDVSGLSYPVTIDPTWTRVVNWSRPAASEPATGTLAVTTGDRVLVVGGDASTVTARVDMYDPSADSWSLVGPLATGRANHVVASIAGGKALAIGGRDSFSNIQSSVELFDPTTLTWSSTGSLLTAREGAHVVTLTDGRVLVAGGTNTSNVTTAEIYDPSSGKWTAAGTMPVSGGGSFQPQYLLVAPSVRAIGLATDPTTSVWTAIIYNPVTNAWSAGKPIADLNLYGAQSFGAKVTALGYRSSTGDSVGVIYDSGTNTWGAFTVLPTDVPNQTSETSIVRLSTGNLVSNGSGASAGSGGLFDATTQTWSATSMPTTSGALGGIALSGGRAFFADSNGGELFGTFSDGAVCSTADQCASGFCADGVCCKTACDAQCQACNEPSKVGTCVTIAGKPRGTRTPCGGTDCPGTCDGASTACVPAQATLACGIVSCAGSTFTGLGHCSGTDTTCVAADAKPCAGNFACESGTACKTSCSGDTDCATGFHCAGSACVATVDAGAETGTDAMMEDAAGDSTASDSGAPDSSPAIDTGAPPTDAPAVEPTSTYQLCTSPGDCQSGFCVEGVCCDTACDQSCHSCALPSAPGRCTLVPLGNDPRHDCSGGNACSMTCGGNGMCVTAFAGSQCAPSKCTGPTQGVGAAFCPGAGAKCPTDAVIAFDCSPYACAPAFGACLTTCSRSDQCAPGYVCDSTSRSCLPASPDAPPPDSGGCAYAGVSGSGLMFGWSMVALVIGWARRRVSNRAARGEARHDA